MPPLPVVTDAVQVVAHINGPSDTHPENVFGFDFGSTTLNQAAADGFCNILATAYGELLWSNTYSLVGCTVTDLRVLDGPQFESVSGCPVVGPQESQPLPLQTCGLISWYTSHRGRSFRGRTYIPGFTEAASDGAHMDSSDHASLAAFADSILGSAVDLGIISRYQPNPSPPPSSVLRDPGIITRVDSRVVHDLWATQRRRQPRG